jgi:F0F1-type ATP synthase membrane subunit b/b'
MKRTRKGRGTDSGLVLAPFFFGTQFAAIDIVRLISILLFAIVTTACTKSDDEQARERAAKMKQDLRDAGRQVGEQAREAGREAGAAAHAATEDLKEAGRDLKNDLQKAGEDARRSAKEERERNRRP